MDTIGLNDETVAKFCHSDEKLFQAIMEGLDNHRALRKSLGTDIMLTDEPELVAQLQEDYVNFYAPATVNPYIALAARGPWIVTSHGAVVHDNGGYGMLGAGHGPSSVIDAMSQRGAVKGEEMSTLGKLRDDAVQIIQLVETIQQEKAMEEE